MDADAWISDRLIPNDITVALQQPVEELHWLEQSLLMAQLSRLAYFPPAQIEAISHRAGLNVCEFLDNDGAQAYLFSNDNDLIIVARGTEPNQWNDIRADANAITVLLEIGRVHRGFNGEVEHLWPLIENRIRHNTRPTYFAGHSLGAAMAMVCAGRCKHSAISTNPRALFTFGSPRVGDKRYIHYVNLKHYRWVNNNDIVTRIPPTWLGYRHSGFELYLNHRGRLCKSISWLRTRDRLKGLFKGMIKWKLDYLSDHSMVDYILNIRAHVQELHAGKKFPDPAAKFRR